MLFTKSNNILLNFFGFSMFTICPHWDSETFVAPLILLTMSSDAGFISGISRSPTITSVGTNISVSRLTCDGSSNYPGSFRNIRHQFASSKYCFIRTDDKGFIMAVLKTGCVYTNFVAARFPDVWNAVLMASSISVIEFLFSVWFLHPVGIADMGIKLDVLFG